ncbi:MAG: hypothetical protein IKM75_08700 [Bacteroidales bacterium]|nr:hypothetical protein [Bacteroidales bacterium]
MKKALLTLLALACFTLAYSQSGNVKDVRQTYLWDVTLSMQGKAKNSDGTPTPAIWNQVKDAIIADIQQISDDRTEIVVIPFQHKALDEWRQPATEAGKNALIAKINAYTIPLFTKADGKIVPAKGKGGTTWTCLFEPLQYVVDKVLTADKIDVVKLMTDGIPDEHQKEYEDLLGRWCSIAKEKDAYGFYIMLTSQAVEGKTVLEKIDPCRFEAIDVAKLGGTDVSLLMLTPQQNIAFNVREDYGEEVTIKYAHSGSGKLQPGYKVHVYSYENSYVQIDQVVDLKDDYTVTVKAQYLMSKTEMIETLSIEENEKVFLYSEPADGMDVLPHAMTRILETPTTMEMINKPEKTVKFHVL